MVNFGEKWRSNPQTHTLKLLSTYLQFPPNFLSPSTILPDFFLSDCHTTYVLYLFPWTSFYLPLILFISEISFQLSPSVRPGWLVGLSVIIFYKGGNFHFYRSTCLLPQILPTSRHKASHHLQSLHEFLGAKWPLQINFVRLSVRSM